jgi:hypothetical protein
VINGFKDGQEKKVFNALEWPAATTSLKRRALYISGNESKYFL